MVLNDDSTHEKCAVTSKQMICMGHQALECVS
jgi:hypothetical protein